MSLFDEDAPFLRGNPHNVEFSTCTDLVEQPTCIFDCNRYYRLLGFGWPYRHISRSDLREAYRDGGGPDDAMKTNAFKHLINAQMRQHYDWLRLGEIYMDSYVFAWLRRKVDNEPSLDEPLGAQDERAIFREGLKVDLNRLAGESPGDGVDNSPAERDDDPPQQLDLPPFLYGYYQWRSRCADLERLSTWQSLLVEAFRDREVVIKLAVGFHGNMPQRWLLGSVGYRTVVYLNDRELPTSTLARAVVDRVLATNANSLA